MHARYYPWGIAGGMLALAVPGTPLWAVPVLGALAHMVYDTDPAGWQVSGQRLLTSARALPERAQQGRALIGRAAQALPSKEPRSASQPALSIRSAPRDPLLTTLDEQPHRLVIGHTRGGKTTLMHALATSWAQEGARVLVCDPDASPGQWPGCRVVGGGDNFGAIGEALPLVEQVIERRRAARSQGVREFAPVHLVIDEAQDVVAELPLVLPLVETIARRGAKLNLHLTVGVQDKQVGTLGLEGKSHLLRNFMTVDVFKDRQGQRMAAIKDPTGAKIALPIPQLVDPETLITERPQQPRPHAQPQPRRQTAARPVVSDQALLAGMLNSPQSVGSVPSPSTGRAGEAPPEASESAGTLSPSGESGESGPSAGTSVIVDGEGRNVTVNTNLIFPDRRRPTQGSPWARRRRERRDRYAEVRELVRQGVKTEDIRTRLRLRRGDVYALARRARAELGQAGEVQR